MSNDMRIALAQINTTVGDFSGNVAKIIDFAQRAEQEGADIVAFPELAITGYPPRDFVEQQAFLDASEAALQDVATRSASLKVALVVGYVARTQAVNALPAQNAVAAIHEGRVVSDQRKILLPNYDVFDEARYFTLLPHSRFGNSPGAGSRL
jgi:NAD+ synthase (glutamine-hydrolysing)